MLRKSVALCGVLVCLSVASHAFSQVPGHAIFDVSGIVFSEVGNQRIAYATIRLCDEGQHFLQELAANDSGEFTFQGLRPGHFILQVRAGGFQPADVAVDLSFTSARGLSVLLKRASVGGPTGPAISAHELSMPERARELVSSGQRKFHVEKDAAGALRDLEAAVSKAPTYYEAFHQIGVVYLSLQKTADAEKSFRKSVELSQSSYADADIALGSLLLDRGDTANGEPLLRQGLELNPHSWMGYFMLGKLDLIRGHLPAALQSAQKAAGIAPGQLLPHRLLAVIYLQQKDYAALLGELDAYIALDPDSPAGMRAKELRAQTEQALSSAPSPAVAEN